MRKKKEAKPEYPKVYESFSEPWGLLTHVINEPSAFNGRVSVRKYRVTVELIEEPIEVIHERLESLWLACDNWHHLGPLEAAAKQYGYTFKGQRGTNKPNK